MQILHRVNDPAALMVAGVLALGLPAAARADEVFHLPAEVKLKAGAVPPCTPLRVAPGDLSGKRVTLENVGGPWGAFKVKPSVIEQGRFEDFSECVASTAFYSENYAAETLAAFNGDVITEGMPIDFAKMVLGPVIPLGKWETKEERLARWAPSEAQKGATLHYFGARSITAWRLRGANTVRIRTGKFGQIVSIIIREDRAATHDLSFLENVSRDPSGHYAAGMGLYEQGDHGAAFRVWLPLAEAGHPPAQYSVADLYYRAEGVERDLEMAVRWFREAAENHYPSAQYHLGFLYATGEGVPTSLTEAYRWMDSADKLGHQDAAKGRDRVAEMMQPEELETAKQLVKEVAVSNPVLQSDINKVSPIYPELARVARVDGAVLLQALVDTEGRVNNVDVTRCNRPNLGFEEAAIESVIQWRYEPAMLDGEPIEVYFTVFVEFTLH